MVLEVKLPTLVPSDTYVCGQRVMDTNVDTNVGTNVGTRYCETFIGTVELRLQNLEGFQTSLPIS